MPSKDRVEMERAKILKMYRTWVRLKHSLRADEEINANLPRIEAEFNRALAEGKPFQIEAASVFEE